MGAALCRFKRPHNVVIGETFEPSEPAGPANHNAIRDFDDLFKWIVQRTQSRQAKNPQHCLKIAITDGLLQRFKVDRETWGQCIASKCKRFNDNQSTRTQLGARLEPEGSWSLTWVSK
jgi:hypothetical protein